MPSVYYNINDYLSISATSSYSLPESTKTVIQFLSNRFGGYSVSEVKPREKKYKGQRSNDDSWGTIRDFKPTVIAEKKSDVEQWISDIRGALNKISIKNYDTNSNIIVEKLREINGSESTSEEDIKNVAVNIFEIASTNKFFSEIYANLYKRLMDEFHDMFSSILDVCIQGFTEKIKSIQYVDQNTNYDEFCKYNKENDKRKATSVFITNLVKAGVIPMSTAIWLINELHDVLVIYMKESGKLNEVEEITENIFLLLTSYNEILRESAVDLKMHIQSLAELKPKELPSISSRAIFKYIDILEKMNRL
jgi:hypothetical protein